MTEIRILLADDQQLVREGLRALLDLIPDIRVVGEAGDGAEAVERAQQMQPDVVLMDVRMPGLDGVAATRRLHEACPEVKVIILTTFDDDEYVFEGLRGGRLPAQRRAIGATGRGDPRHRPGRGLHTAICSPQGGRRVRPPDRTGAPPP